MKKILPLIIAGIICVSLFAAYFIISGKINKEDEGEEKAGGELIAINEKDKITAISVCSANGSFALFSINGEWRLTGDQKLPVDPKAVDSLKSALEHIISLRKVSDSGDDLSVYGLAEPALAVNFTCGGEAKRYLFGNVNDYYGGYYFKAFDSDAVYIVEAALYTALDKETEELFKLDSMPVIGGDSSLSLILRDGSEIDPKEDEKLLALIQSLGIERYIDYGESVYPTYGLDRAVELMINKETRISLSVGESDEIIYMLINDSHLIYLASCEDPAALAGYLKQNALKSNRDKRIFNACPCFYCKNS